MDQRQQLLNFISQCIEGDAKLDIRFRPGESKQKAKLVMEIFHEITGAMVTEEKGQYRARIGNIELVHRFGKDEKIIII